MQIFLWAPVVVATGFALYLAIVDIQEMKIPNRILIRGYATTGVMMLIASLLEGEFLLFIVALIGALFSLFFFYFIHILHPAGLGMGDVKFAGLLGAVMSWINFPVALIGLAVAFIASALFSIGAIIFRAQRLDLMIPFGPFMLFGLLFVEYRYLIRF